jgi:hypothetical protein
MVVVVEELLPQPARKAARSERKTAIDGIREGKNADDLVHCLGMGS